MTELTDFELRNAAAGPDPFVLTEYADDPDRDAIVLLFLRDYHCPKCKDQVATIAASYDQFEGVGADVVAILPDPVGKARDWNDELGLSFPLLADESKTASEEYDQPVRFGAVGALHDMVGRMPEAVVVDTTGSEPSVAHVHRGKTPGDRPSVDDLLGHIEAVRSATA